jgi:hypothetical protein
MVAYELLRHPNLVEIRVIPTKKDIAFVEYADEASATLAKEALHNFKIDGETKMKVGLCFYRSRRILTLRQVTYARK